MAEQESKKIRFKSIWIDETKYKTYYTKKYANRVKWTKPDDNMIYSFLPGTILDVLVKNGQKLKKGQRVLDFEAMKMKNRIYIHKACVVKNVHVKKGDIVTKGKVLLEVEPV